MNKPETVTVPREALLTLMHYTRTSGLTAKQEKELADACGEITRATRRQYYGRSHFDGAAYDDHTASLALLRNHSKAKWRAVCVYALGSLFSIVVVYAAFRVMKYNVDIWLGYPP